MSSKSAWVDALTTLMSRAVDGCYRRGGEHGLMRAFIEAQHGMSGRGASRGGGADVGASAMDPWQVGRHGDAIFLVQAPVLPRARPIPVPSAS